MPYRKHLLVDEEIYHVFNRSIAAQPIFSNSHDYSRIAQLIDFYRFPTKIRFSHFINLNKEMREVFLKNRDKTNPQVKIFAFCLMPNHLHLLLKQNQNNGISDFMKKIQQAYSKYFNLKYGRTGSLFQSMFKAVRIETDEQLLHVSRYIHLNPVSSFLIKENVLENYMWSSFKNYLDPKTGYSFVETKLVLDFFSQPKKYREFVFDQIDYQQELEKIKHLKLD